MPVFPERSLHQCVNHPFLQEAPNHQVIRGGIHLFFHSLRIAVMVVRSRQSETALSEPRGFILQDADGVVPRHHVFRAAVHPELVVVPAVEKRRRQASLPVETVFQFGVEIVDGRVCI